MSFLDKIKQQAGIVAEAAGNVAQSAVKQSKTIASVGRVKLAIASEEDKMKKAYTELGRLFYRDYEAQAEADMTDYQPWCDKVADAKAQIARLNEELEKLHAQDTEEPQQEPETVIEVNLTASQETTEQQAKTDAWEDRLETPAEEPQQLEPEEQPTVGTLYVDVTNTEE